MTKTLTAVPVDQNPIGYFRVFARPPGGLSREITVFRGAPITIDEASFVDPFSESTASLTCPQITIFDCPGQGDLDWVVRDCDINIVWQNFGPYDYEWSWEGFIASYDFSFDPSNSNFKLDLKGCLYALDNYLAKPGFPRRPIPYEVLIQRAFDTEIHPARLVPLKTTFPINWNTKVPSFDFPNYQSFLKPTGVSTGHNWTGLTSRSTGSWEAVLTGFVQTLLGTMYDEGSSQWTIRNNGHRSPELFLRRPPPPDSPRILEVTLGAPGVGFSGSRDFTQSANVIYGQGKDEAGIEYSGMNISPNGRTYYKPFAWNPLVYPRTAANPALVKAQHSRETLMRIQDGLDEVSAFRVAQTHLQRFADPGIAGTITLNTDPRLATGEPFPRMLIKAGRTVRVNGLLGIKEGMLVHITQVGVNFNDLSVTLTFDSKYRDALTVDEVRARTRDALDPVRTLQVGKYGNTVSDLLFPWTSKSGIIPNAGDHSAVEFFNEKLPVDAQWPYEKYTKMYPPKKYKNYYIKIGKSDYTNSTNNWSSAPKSDKKLAIPIRMSEAGTIRLTQVCAYDADGKVLPVRFHMSLYQTNGVGPGAMPRFNGSPSSYRYLRPLHKANPSYESGNSHPFFENAWESIREDGTTGTDDSNVVAGNSKFVVGWGTFYEPAGYSPGRFSRGPVNRTGKLEDTASWSWSNHDLFDLRNGAAQPEDAGCLFVEFYCDDQDDKPVYFMGRFIRQEPGGSQ